MNECVEHTLIVSIAPIGKKKDANCTPNREMNDNHLKTTIGKFTYNGNNRGPWNTRVCILFFVGEAKVNEWKFARKFNNCNWMNSIKKWRRICIHQEFRMWLNKCTIKWEMH